MGLHKGTPTRGVRRDRRAAPVPLKNKDWSPHVYRESGRPDLSEGYRPSARRCPHPDHTLRSGPDLEVRKLSCFEVGHVETPRRAGDMPRPESGDISRRSFLEQRSHKINISAAVEVEVAVPIQRSIRNRLELWSATSTLRFIRKFSNKLLFFACSESRCAKRERVP